MTEEDRAARLAEMTGNAAVHEEARWQRLADARKRDRVDDDAAAVAAENGQDDKPEKAGERQDFMKTATRELYGTGQGGSVEDQIGRRKFYSERRSDQAAFRR